MNLRHAAIAVSLASICCVLPACSGSHAVPPISRPDVTDTARMPTAEMSETGTAKILFRFQNSTQGAIPNSPLAVDSQGNLYGTTVSGGANDSGVVFKLSPKDGKYVETVLYNFSELEAPGGAPGPVTLDRDGNLWGITASGMTEGEFGLFELSPGSNNQWKIRLVYNKCFILAGNGSVTLHGGDLFAGCGDRIVKIPRLSGKVEVSYLKISSFVYPNGGLAIDKSGSVFFTSLFWPNQNVYAGPTYEGTHYKVGFTLKQLFWENDLTEAPPAIAPDGSLIQTGAASKYSPGQVFRATPNGSGGFNSPEKIYHFVQNGSTTAPAIDRAGAIYFADGAHVKKLTPSGNAYTPSVLYKVQWGKFDGVWLDSANHVFAVLDGGPDDGTIYEITQ